MKSCSGRLRCEHPPYQNKHCKAYYLQLDNGGYAFEWVSNYQVITPIHLKPLTMKNRTFNLPAADKKTIAEAMEKRRREEQRAR